MSIDSLLRACRVPDTVQEACAGLWEIRRFSAGQIPIQNRKWIGRFDGFSALCRLDYQREMSGIGEVVMEDSERELKRHLPILLKAYGRILVSGLGLGCVVRGLLSKREVTHVDVIEIDPAILKLVGAEFKHNPRVTIHLGDAEKIKWPHGTSWDFGWHDIWTDDEHLALAHTRLLTRYQDLCVQQGAWMFPREGKRLMGDLIG